MTDTKTNNDTPMVRGPTVKLSGSGDLMPQVGLGTWQSAKGKVKAAVTHAIKGGYRHIDCAWIYGNEKEVGEGIQDALDDNVKREDLFVTTKLWNTHHRGDQVVDALRASLANLGLDYVDLYLVHWPMSFREGVSVADLKPETDFLNIPHTETWAALEKCVELGLTRNIGLSNFNSRQIAAVVEKATIKPAVLQVESHPYLNQIDLKKYCDANNIVLTAYSPLGSPGTFDGAPDILANNVVTEIAERHGKSSAQVLIRYQVDRGNVVIPKSVTPARIDQNWNVFDFQLSADDIAKLDGFEEQLRLCAFKVAKSHELYGFNEDERELAKARL